MSTGNTKSGPFTGTFKAFASIRAGAIFIGAGWAISGSRLRDERHSVKCRQRLWLAASWLAELLPPAKQLGGMNPRGPRHFRSNRARLQGRGSNPLLLSSRPAPATLHRRDHFNLRLGHKTSPRIAPRTCRNRSAPQGGPHRTRTITGQRRSKASCAPFRTSPWSGEAIQPVRQRSISQARAQRSGCCCAEAISAPRCHAT
jgi:hypothetical protein